MGHYSEGHIRWGTLDIVIVYNTIVDKGHFNSGTVNAVVRVQDI